MLHQKPKSLSWNYEARAAYKKLQEAFCTVPILSHPELQLPFIVEVDDSTTGVGAVLSQYHAEYPRITLVLTSPGNFPQRSGTTILEILSFLPLNWHWRNGGTGWRKLNTPLRSSLTTRTWNISEVPRG